MNNSAAPWREDEPPKDGTTIVAIGRVIWSDEFSTSASPFTAAVRWFKDQSGYEGWHWERDGMTVAQTLEDEVKVDWWLPAPASDGQRPIEPSEVSVWYECSTEPQRVVKGFEAQEDEAVVTLLAGIPKEGGNATKRNFEMLVRMAFQGGLVAALKRDLAGRDSHCPQQSGETEAQRGPTSPNPAGLSFNGEQAGAPA